MNRWIQRLRAARYALLILSSVLGLALGYCGKAHAQTSNNYPDQGSAYAACQQGMAAMQAGNPAFINPVCTYLPNYSGRPAYECGITNPSNGQNIGCNRQPVPYRYYRFDTATSCSARPATSGGFFRQGAQTTCNNGCRYTPGTITETMVVAGKTYYRATNATPTGDVCTQASTDDSEVAADDCTTVGSLTQCVTKEGKHCAVASTGKKFCWTPAETGAKVSGNDAAVKSPQGVNVNTPQQAPSNGGEWEQKSQGQVTTGAGSGPGTTNNVTTFQSNYGGTGNGGGAEGDPEGGEGGENGGAGPGTGDTAGDLYTPSTDTVEGLMSTYWNSAKQTEAVSYINTFLGSCAYAGTCPQMTYEAEYMGKVSFTQLCDGSLGSILVWAGFVVLAVAAYGGFRIAIY